MFGASVEPVVAVADGASTIAASLVTIYYGELQPVLSSWGSTKRLFLGSFGFGVVLIAPVLLALVLIPPGERSPFGRRSQRGPFPGAMYRLVFGFWVSWQPRVAGYTRVSRA